MCKHIEDKECVYVSYSIMDTKYFLLLFLLNDHFEYSLPCPWIYFLSFSTFSMSWPLWTALAWFLVVLRQGEAPAVDSKWKERDPGVYCTGSLPAGLQIDRYCISPPKLTACVDNSCSTAASLSSLWEICHLLAPPSLMALCPC